MQPYENIQPDQLIIRDFLARDRTVLANERTLLAYIRTSVMLLGSGISLIKLFPTDTILLMSGYGFLPLSLCVLIFGIWRFRKVRRDLAIFKRT